MAKDFVTDETKKVFEKFDADGDGKISAAELGAILAALGSEASPEELQRTMSEIDTDGDGFIDLKEFSDFHRGGDDVASKDLRDAFDLYDSDRNGKISASELHAVLKNLGEKCTLQDCRRMISSVDADGDGYVDFEEFKKMMTRA
ncbi:hypothetical protein RJ640_010939 [Escallonia rubra]|uniref:EF-hand domain-containing protein n=1 Tax=Escallonia rubra TaxID=112253 RepID=A0AA88UIY1_9ASTE|nr:hypothetical protein RJ640_010939 [Escallonia rubra]